MAYTNSPLVNYTRLSPNHSGQRTHSIDRLTPHCVVGQLSVETIGNIFAPASRQASCNYSIGSDGRKGLHCEEKNRSWCSSSNANDQRAITIEGASDRTAPYAMNDKAYNSLIELSVDICKRNGKKKLLWFGDKNKTLNYNPKPDEMVITVHRWFENKSCPGDWLYNRMGEFADAVTKLLSGSQPEKPTGVLYRVQVGAFSSLANAREQEKRVRAKGFETYLVQVGSLYKIQVGAFSVRANADTMMKKIKSAGFDCFITTEKGKPVGDTPTSSVKTVEEGSRVKVKRGAKTYTGGNIASFVYNKVYTVDELSGDRAVLDRRGICTPVNVKDLIVQ